MNETWRNLYSKALRLIPANLPGKTRFARFILGIDQYARDICVHDRFGCTFLVPNLHEPIGFYLLIDGVYEPLAARFIADNLRPGSTLVDVGANIGVFAIPAAKRVGPTGCVVAVEPSPGIIPYLTRNIADNRLFNVRLKTCAAYDREEKSVPFFEAPTEKFGMGALAAQFDALPTTVPARTLDNVLAEEGISHVDLLKVDVEGFEALVFKGAKELLAGLEPPAILFEFCDWAEERAPDIRIGDAQHLLLESGYRLWRLSDYIRGIRPLVKVLTNGFEMLVAIKQK